MTYVFTGPVCEHCQGPAPHYYEVGVVFTYLCPPCRTDLQEFIFAEVSLHDVWVGIARRNQNIADPLAIGSIIDDNLDNDIKAFNLIRDWIRAGKPQLAQEGDDEPTTIPKDNGAERPRRGRRAAPPGSG